MMKYPSTFLHQVSKDEIIGFCVEAANTFSRLSVYLEIYLREERDKLNPKVIERNLNLCQT